MTRPGDQNAQDAAIEELLKRQGGASKPAGGPACGDADLLAAYAEGSLGGREREAFEKHLAACGACREAVARLVRLAPARAEAPRAARAWWAPWAWAAPALAGMVLVGSLVWYERGRILEPSTKTMPALAKVAQPPQAQPEAQSTARPASPVPPAEPPANEVREKDQLARARPTGRSSVKTVPASGTASDAAGAPSSSLQTYAPAPAAAPEPPPNRTELKQKEEETAALDRRPADSKKALARDAAAETIARENAQPMASKAARPISPMAAKPGAGIGGAVNAAVERLRAEGAAIQEQRLGKQHWVLMEDGRLFHSSDAGQSWQEVAVPERARWFSFENEKRGRILGRSGDRYATADGGETWRRSKTE